MKEPASARRAGDLSSPACLTRMEVRSRKTASMSGWFKRTAILTNPSGVPICNFSSCLLPTKGAFSIPKIAPPAPRTTEPNLLSASTPANAPAQHLIRPGPGSSVRSFSAGEIEGLRSAIRLYRGRPIEPRFGGRPLPPDAPSGPTRRRWTSQRREPGSQTPSARCTIKRAPSDSAPRRATKLAELNRTDASGQGRGVERIIPHRIACLPSPTGSQFS